MVNMTFENTGRERSLDNKLEETNEKIKFVNMLIDIGAITKDEDVPEEAFARMSELAALPYFHSTDSVQALAAMEFLFSKISGREELTEAAGDISEYLGEIVSELFSDEFANVDDDTVQIVVRLAVSKMASGKRLTDALLEAVEERKAILRTTPDLTGYVDSQDSVVNLENPRQ